MKMKSDNYELENQDNSNDTNDQYKEMTLNEKRAILLDWINHLDEEAIDCLIKEYFG